MKKAIITKRIVSTSLLSGEKTIKARNSAATGRLSSLPLSLSGFNFSVCLRIRNGSHGRSLKQTF